MKNKEDSNRIAIALVVDNFNNVLMGQRADNKLFTVPCGHIHIGECPFSGVIRELKEETDLDAETIKLVKVEFNKKKNLLLYLFEVQVDLDQKIEVKNDPDHEFIEAAFVDPNMVKDELTVPLKDNLAVKYWAYN